MTYMKQLSIFGLVTSLFFCLIHQSMTVSAEPSEEEKLGYSVRIVQPTTQIDPTKGYFYVETTPGKPQELEVKVKSTKKEPVTVKMSVTNAITGNNGTIDYSEDKTLSDPTLTDSIQSMTKLSEEKITVQNFEEKTVKVTLTPPDKPYEGVKMGALVFTLDTGKDEKAKGVSTEFAYRIGLITAGSGDEFNNGQTLVLEEVKASIKRGKKMVLAKLQNPEPKTLENLTIEATMKNKGNNKLIKRKKVENYRMAPNSHFEFEMDWGIDHLPSGQYILDLAVANDYKEWQLSKEFSITNEQARKINKESAFNIITPTWVKLSTIVLLIVQLALTSFLIVRRVKWEKARKNTVGDL